jgi:hypothetical protein
LGAAVHRHAAQVFGDHLGSIAGTVHGYSVEG